jgi:TolB-like protein/class 3 adenylate cyclase/Tfp pilus assembly protein PilF
VADTQPIVDNRPMTEHLDGPSATTRRAAALHGDVAGYSRLIADNEIETHNTLQALRRIIEAEVAANDGEVVSFAGDEFLAVIPTESGAITAAMTMQRRIAEENQSLPQGRKMRFRLGVHAGNVSAADGQWYGDAINVAARLQALADPGGINVSKIALDAAGDLAFDFQPLGRKQLKNIPEPVTAFKIIDKELIADRTRPWRRRLPLPKRPSLAVSPFVNLGGPEDSHFADGLMMALVIALMRIPGLDLVSENSTLRYRDHPFSAQQLGHELGVRYVLEGAVQRSGDRVRVMTQLLDVEDGTTAWADRFESTFDDIFSAQDDIVSAIVAALDVEVIGGEVARTYRSRISPGAVEVVYRGLQHLSKGSLRDYEHAIEAFEDVIEREPDEAMGHDMAAVSHLLIALGQAAEKSSNHYAKAAEYAHEAIERGDPSGLGRTVQAYVRLVNHDWDGAMEAASQAIAARPSCDLTYGVAASVLRYLGETDEAVEYANRAIRLSPLLATWYESTLANAHLLAGDYDEAAELAESVVAEDDNQFEALLTLAAAQTALGRQRHAAAAIEKARLSRPGLSTEMLRHELPYRDEKDLGRFLSQLEASGLS